MKLHVSALFFLFTTLCMACYVQKKTTTKISHHISYPACARALLVTLKKYSLECAVSCEAYLLEDPYFLEKYIEVRGTPLTPDQQKNLIIDACALECEECKINVTKLCPIIVPPYCKKGN